MMENVSPAEGQDRSMMNKKLRSPNQIGETHTMDSFQDGGQQNMNTEQNEYMNPMEGPHMNADANSFPPSSREQMMMVDTFNRMNQNVHASQMQGYNPYNRENFNSGDQHGGMPMTGSSEYTNQGSPFQGQYARPGHPGSMKPGMRPGMGPPGGNMMPSSYPHSQQRNMMSGQSISQQSGPTPTLNQLLQTPNAPQRMPANNYGDYPPKGANDVGGSNPNYGLQQQWVGNPRQMGMFPQNMMSGPPGAGYRNQNMSDMNQQRSASYQMQQSQYGGQYPPSSRYGAMGMPSRPGQMNVPNQGFNQMGPHYGQQQQFNSMGYGAGPPPPMSQPPSSSSHPTQHPQSQQQNSQMSSGQPPGITPPPPTGSRPSPSPIPDSSPMHQRQLSPSPSRQQQQQPTPSSQTSTSPSPQQVPLTKQQPSPSSNSSNWNATNNGIKKGSEENESGMEQPGSEDVASDNLQGIPTSSSTQQPSVSALRPTPSPVGSSGSRSNTPASLTGNQAGSPMPPRPPSQHDVQTSRLTQSPMGTQGYNQQMMPPPPMGPNQMNYGPGGGKMPGGNVSGPVGHYQQYNSHYPPQGNYPGRQGPGMMGNAGMPSYSQQNMYNGPNQGQMGGNSHIYNNLQGGRNMPNSNFNMYGQNSMMGMNSQYGQLNSHMGPGPPNQGSGQGPGSGPGPGPVPTGMNSMGHSGVENVPGSGSGHRPQGPNTASSSGSSSAVKSAQAAAQAALIAAANTATRSQPGRPSVNTPQKMFGPHSGGQVNHSGYGSGMNMNNVPTSMNQMPNSHSPVPNSVGPYLNMPKSSVSDSMPNVADSSTHNSSSTSQSNCPPAKAVDSSVSSSMDSSDSKLPSSQNIPPVSVENMQHDSNSVGSNVSSESVPPLDTNVNNSTAISSVPPQPCSVDSNKDSGTNTPPCSTPNARPESHGADSNLSSLTEESSQGDVSSSMMGEQKEPEVPAITDQSNLPPNSKQEMPITTTATTNNVDGNIVTQSITSPLPCATESSNSNDAHPDHIPQQNCLPVQYMPPVEEQIPDKKKKKTGGDISKLYEMGSEPDRRFFIDRMLSFLDERNAPLNNMPSISKQPLDLYKLYFCVRERGGMLEVTKAKKWKEICGLINIGSSASAAFTLKKNYIKYLFHYECRFDRGGMDPGPILAQMEAQLQQKRESKNRRAPSPAGSQGSQDAFRPPSTPNSNSQGLDGFPPSMVGPGYMQNSDPNMGPMGGMMPQNSMMNNMMPPNSMGGMPHNQMMGGNMGNMHHPGMMGGNSYNMMPGHRPGMMMPSNNMMGNNMNMPGNNMGMSGNNMGMPPGNNMGMPSGNNMGMPPGNNMPSSGMASAPTNSDCVSCQDPFSDEPNSYGYRQRGPPNSQMPNYSGMTPQNNMGNFSNNNNNFNRPNMPPSSISQSSIPPNSMGQNMPPNSMGQNMPPSSMGQNVPPNSMGQNVPPNSMGQNMPPNSMGQSLPQSSMTQSVTMSSMGQSLPPTSITQSMPSSPMSQNLASNSMTSNSMPPNSMAPSGSAAGMGEGQALPPSNMPPNSMTQSIPPSSIGQSAPQNMPPNTASNFQPNSDIPRGQSGPQVPSQDQLNPFSNYQKSDISTTNTPANEKMSSSGQFTSNTNTTVSTGGRNFPFGDQFSKPERFDSPTPVQSTTPTPTPPPQRQPTPQSSQSMPPHPTQQQPSEAGFPGRYGNQQPPPGNPQQGMHAGGPTDQYGHMQSFPPQQGFTTPNKGMMGHEQYSGYPPGQQSPYPGHRPQMRSEMSGPPGVYGTPSKRYQDPFGNQAGYNAQSSAYNSQSSGYNAQSASYSSSGMSGYNAQSSGYGDRPSPGPMQYPYQQRDSMSSSYDPQVMDGRGNAQWSSMPQRFPHGSAGMGPNPNMPSHMGPVPGSYRGHMGQRMSPTRDHKSGYMSPPKVKMPSQFPTKKEIPFPPDSVEAITPNYSKRRRLTKADVGQIEAWRVMMALKSGLLAESTWALDTLNILLYDDSAISFFNLAHLPGLLEVLLEHFRKCLISMFGDTFEEIEKMSDVSDDKYNRDLLVMNLLEENETKHGAKAKEGLPDYTYITRQGKEVKVEEDTEEASPLDAKKWDLYCGYSYKYGHWQLGGGDMSSHVVPCFGSKEENNVFKKLFIRPLMELKDEFKEENSETNVILEDSKNDSTEDVTKELQKEKATEEIEQESMDTSVEEIPKDKIDSDEKVATNTKNNCKKEPVKETGHTKNNILRKPQIKEEPVDLSVESGSLKTDIEMKKEPAEMKKEPAENEDSKLGCEMKSQTSEKCDVKAEEEKEKDTCNGENIKVEKEETVAPVEGSKIKEEEKVETLNNTGVKLQSSPSKRKADRDLEDESYQRDEPPLCTASFANEELGRRCVCISNIFRSLSSIPSNHAELSKHPGFMYTLGKLLMLNHRHLPRNTTRKKFDRDDSELEDLMDSQMQQNDEEWWWEHFALLHENTFVILANICGHLELKHYPEEVCLPILDGLLHWAVCPSSCASDPLPSSATSVLSPQRLVLEALCKLCIHETNVDLLLATPPFDRIVQLFTMLTKCLANRSEPVTLEFAIVLLSELVQGDCSAARAIAMQHPSISLLLDFLETAEQKAMQVANHHGINALRDNPEAMGTSLDMLRRAANILLHLASVPENRSLFNHHQQRLLSLVMSQILDQFVAQILSDVLFQCFQSEDS